MIPVGTRFMTPARNSPERDLSNQGSGSRPTQGTSRDPVFHQLGEAVKSSNPATWLTLEGEQKSVFLAAKWGFQSLNHNKQKCKMFPNNNGKSVRGSGQVTNTDGATTGHQSGKNPQTLTESRICPRGKNTGLFSDPTRKV